MNFNIFNSLILAGVIQGFVFGCVWLFTKKYRTKSTYFLVALILTYSLNNLQYYLLDIEIVSVLNFYSYPYICYSLLMPPLFLFYGLSIMNPAFKASVLQKGLLLPFIISFLLASSYKFEVIALGKEPVYNSFLANIVSWSEYVAIIFSVIVVTHLILKVNRFTKNQQFSVHIIQPQLQWFKIILLFQLFAISVWAALEIAFANAGENYYFYPVWIIIAIITYWMGHVGIYKYGVQEERKNIRKASHARNHSISVEKPKKTHIADLEIFIIQEKNFLDTALTLESVAGKMSLSKGYLSKLINTELGMSFSEYLNNLRVEEAKAYLANPEFSNYTLVAIGLEAGFNSKSAFNASFKKVTGVTPSEYKKKNTNLSQ